jgi:formylglycine-generating enzyme required for sulfatase activity
MNCSSRPLHTAGPSFLFAVAVLVSPAAWLEAGGSPAKNRTEDMILIPGGKFVMGLRANQAQRLVKAYRLNPDLFANQKSQVVDVKPFWIDRYEVTNRQYRDFLRATGHKPPPSWLDRGYPTGTDDFPFDGADLEDALAFARWSHKRLPTEAEWEKAARGTDGRLWVWGNQWREGACKMDDSHGAPLSASPAPVGSYPLDRSPYGVMDMAGNVLELVTADLPGEAKGLQLKKGGCFLNEAPYSVLCSTRHADPGGSQMGYTGFRCARDATAEEVGQFVNRSADSRQEPRPSHDAFARPTDRKSDPSIEQLRPRPDLYRKGKLHIYPIYQVDAEHPLYAFLPVSRRGKEALARVTPWSVEINAAYLPGDRFRVFFEEFYPYKMKEIRFSDDFTRADIRASIPKRGDIAITLTAGPDFVDIVYGNCGVQMCLMCLFAPNFTDQDGLRTYLSTDLGLKPEVEVRHHLRERFWNQGWDVGRNYAELPGVGPRVQGNHVLTVSRDRQWLVAPVSLSGPPNFLFHNREYSCIHCNPGSGGRIDSSNGWVYFEQRIYLLQGTPADLVRRYEQDRKTEGGGH